MKERIVCERLRCPDKEGYFYVKTKQYLTWQFYFRVIKKWFTPCKKCQSMLNKMWNVGVCIDAEFYERFIERCSVRICSECLKAVVEEMSGSEVILGNQKYDPPIELSRKWIDDEDSTEEVSKAEHDRFHKVKA